MRFSHSTVPVISAVGHETDVSVADLVADHRRYYTQPPQLSRYAHRHDVLKGLRDIQMRMTEATERRIKFAREQRLDQLAEHRPAVPPAASADSRFRTAFG